MCGLETSTPTVVTAMFSLLTPERALIRLLSERQRKTYIIYSVIFFCPPGWGFFIISIVFCLVNVAVNIWDYTVNERFCRVNIAVNKRVNKLPKNPMFSMVFRLLTVNKRMLIIYLGIINNIFLYI